MGVLMCGGGSLLLFHLLQVLLNRHHMVGILLLLRYNARTGTTWFNTIASVYGCACHSLRGVCDVCRYIIFGWFLFLLSVNVIVRSALAKLRIQQLR